MPFFLGIIEMIGSNDVWLEDTEVFLVDLSISREYDHLVAGMLEEIHNKVSPVFAVQPAKGGIDDKGKLPARG